MNYEDLIVLINRLDQSTLSYLDYQTESHHLILAKEIPPLKNHAEPDLVLAKKEANEPIESAIVKEKQISSPSESENLQTAKEASEIVQSPMIGVVYLQPHPDEDVYVQVGDRVEQGDTICIIEAMKIMNEIQAPVSGIVTQIFVENEAVVEFNQPLIEIKA